jgi:hypothetical protein
MSSDDPDLQRAANYSLTDEEIAVLLGLSAPPLIDSPSSSRSLTQVLQKFPTLTKNKLGPRLSKIGNSLKNLTGHEVILTQSRGHSGTFATDQCQDLHPALMKIELAREAARNAAQRQHQLEWLQMASALDKGPVCVGGYPAHIERFLASAGGLMYEYFPWVDFTLADVPREARSAAGTVGNLRLRFDAGEFDFMLAPLEEDEPADFYVYKYSFRVVGALRVLQSLSNGTGHINVHQLKGQKLLVAPPGFSSRVRLARILRGAGKGVDIEDGSVELIEESDPALMRTKAELGTGLAVISDEYSAVGGSTRDFPMLDLSAPRPNQPPAFYQVRMRLLQRPGAASPRLRAFEWVVQELVHQEKLRKRAAAQD